MKVLLFDVYGTLFDVYSVQQKCEQWFPEKGEAIVKLWRQKQLEYSFLREIMGKYIPFSEITKDALHYACRSADAVLTEEAEADLLQQYLHLSPHEEVKSVLSQVKDQYTLAVFSNGSLDMLLPLLENADVMNMFKHKISVDTLQKYKPSPLVYAHARQQTGVRREDILFLSSNTWDIAGAKHFGFQTAWINRNDGVMDILGVQPDYIWRDLKPLCQSLV